MLMGMGLLGWLVSLVAGFAIGLLFFMSMKLQVDYVVKGQGPTWVVPAAMYARMVLVAVVLVLVALLVKNKGWEDKLAAMMLAGVTGLFAARIVVARMVRREEPDGGDDGERD